LAQNHEHIENKTEDFFHQLFLVQ